MSSRWRRLMCRLGRHQWRKQAYGYPPHRQAWEDYKVCRCCGHSVRTIDDVYSESRRSAFPDVPAHVDLMNYRIPDGREYQGQNVRKVFELSSTVTVETVIARLERQYQIEVVERQADEAPKVEPRRANLRLVTVDGQRVAD